MCSMDKQALIRLLGSGNTPAITVFGDFCLDKYLYIDAARDELSVETDLVAYQVTHQKMYAGAGGTITNNLRALGAQVYCVGILGDDGEGMELKRRLEAVGADTRYMVQTDQRQTCTYIKPMRRENGRETELNRLDIRNFTKTPRLLEDALLENLGKALAHSQAVIICDQFMEEDMAAVTGYVRDAIGKLAESYPEKQWYADSRGHIHQFHNVIVKCNHQEIAAIFGEPAENMDYERAGQLAGRLFAANHKPVVVTMGDKGSVVYDGEPHVVPAFSVEGPLDICGAGDACNAGTVFALTKGASLDQAALLGNACSSIVIKQIGVTGTAKLGDALAKLEACS